MFDKKLQNLWLSFKTYIEDIHGEECAPSDEYYSACDLQCIAENAFCHALTTIGYGFTINGEVQKINQ